jgi:hypothetical protein
MTGNPQTSGQDRSPHEAGDSPTTAAPGRPGHARRIKLTEEVRALDTLADPDYWAAWEATVSSGDRRSAEQWARATFEGAPSALRAFIVAGWTVGLGFQLGPRPSPEHVLGWKIASSSPDLIILEAQFRYGVAHNLWWVDGSRVLAGTVVRYNKKAGRPVWAAVAPVHHRVIPYLLGRAAPTR